MENQKTWKVIDLLNTTTDFFQEKKIENARLNAERLLGKVLKLSRVDLYVSFERPVTPEELNQYRSMVKRRNNHEPLQYIIGETGFYDLNISVDPSVLIPRPETELLVEEVLKMKNALKSSPTIVDVGCGSGCIALSIARHWPEATVIGTDISEQSLCTARMNTEKNQLTQDRIQFYQSDIFESWPEALPRQINILVSNPPYIRIDEFETLPPEVKNYEPRRALTDEGDGLQFYKRLMEIVRSDEPPHTDYMFLEMSGSQPGRIIAIAEQYPFAGVEVREDLNQIPRILKIKVNK